MRDIVVSLLILGALPTAFKKPFVGLLLFSLLAYMRLQDLSWGFARDVRWSFYVVIVTFAGFFASRNERKFMIIELRTILMMIMVVLVALSIVKNEGLALRNFPLFTEYAKIILIALFTTGMVNSRDRLRMMVWVIALSFAFFGFKGGLVGLMTGGTVPILRGPGGMLKDNNDFALALAMGVPMMLLIGRSEKREILRRALVLCVPLTAITIALTHSRGGFLALVMGLCVLVWRSRNKLAGFSVMALISLAALFAAPASYVERIGSISEYEQDDSAQARFAAWRTAGVMIQANPIFGVGFGRFQDNYEKYDPAGKLGALKEHGSHVAHNSYLQIWAECGTPAFMPST